MPRAARERLADYADAWAERGVRAWAEGWWRMPVDGGRQARRASSARPPGSVVMHQNVSVCQALILSCFDLRGRRNKIVYEELNFPSVMYVYEAHRARARASRRCRARTGSACRSSGCWRRSTRRRCWCRSPTCVFKSAFMQDVAAIMRRAHEVGALVVADMYQSAGTVPVDVTAWDVDFATGGSVKWLCGGPGRGLPVRAPRLRDTLEPRMTGWMAHEQPFAFETGPERYAADIRRFLHGSPASPRSTPRRPATTSWTRSAWRRSAPSRSARCSG